MRQEKYLSSEFTERFYATQEWKLILEWHSLRHASRLSDLFCLFHAFPCRLWGKLEMRCPRTIFPLSHGFPNETRHLSTKYEMNRPISVTLCQNYSYSKAFTQGNINVRGWIIHFFCCITPSLGAKLQSIYVTRDRVILKFEPSVQIYVAVLNFGCEIQNSGGNVVSVSKINSCELSF